MQARELFVYELEALVNLPTNDNLAAENLRLNYLKLLAWLYSKDASDIENYVFPSPNAAEIAAEQDAGSLGQSRDFTFDEPLNKVYWETIKGRVIPNRRKADAFRRQVQEYYPEGSDEYLAFGPQRPPQNPILRVTSAAKKRYRWVDNIIIKYIFPFLNQVRLILNRTSAFLAFHKLSFLPKFVGFIGRFGGLIYAGRLLFILWSIFDEVLLREKGVGESESIVLRHLTRLWDAILEDNRIVFLFNDIPWLAFNIAIIIIFSVNPVAAAIIVTTGLSLDVVAAAASNFVKIFKNAWLHHKHSNRIGNLEEQKQSVIEDYENKKLSAEDAKAKIAAIDARIGGLKQWQEGLKEEIKWGCFRFIRDVTCAAIFLAGAVMSFYLPLTIPADILMIVSALVLTGSAVGLSKEAWNVAKNTYNYFFPSKKPTSEARSVRGSTYGIDETLKQKQEMAAKDPAPPSQDNSFSLHLEGHQAQPASAPSPEVYSSPVSIPTSPTSSSSDTSPSGSRPPSPNKTTPDNVLKEEPENQKRFYERTKSIWLAPIKSKDTSTEPQVDFRGIVLPPDGTGNLLPSNS